MAAIIEVQPKKDTSIHGRLRVPSGPAETEGPRLTTHARLPDTSAPASPTSPAAISLIPDWCRVSLVIPALNEAQNLPLVLIHIPPGVHEVLLVDGQSTDGTINVAQQMYPSIQILQQEGKGKGAALRTGFAAATGDIIIMLDADGSTDPREIPAFVGALLAGADFAKGSRFIQGGGTADMPLYRKLGNWAFVLAVRVLVGGSYTDLCYGYNAFWARLLPTLNLEAEGFEIETSMNMRALLSGLKVVEVASFESKRAYGTGRLRTIPDGWRVVKTLWRESRRSGRPRMLVRGSAA